MRMGRSGRRSRNCPSHGRQHRSLALFRLLSLSRSLSLSFSLSASVISALLDRSIGFSVLLSFFRSSEFAHSRPAPSLPHLPGSPPLSLFLSVRSFVFSSSSLSLALALALHSVRITVFFNAPFVSTHRLSLCIHWGHIGLAASSSSSLPPSSLPPSLGCCCCSRLSSNSSNILEHASARVRSSAHSHARYFLLRCPGKRLAGWML